MKNHGLGVGDVAKHLGVNKDFGYRSIEKMALLAHRVGRIFRFKTSRLDESVRAGGAGEASDPCATKKKKDD